MNNKVLLNALTPRIEVSLESLVASLESNGENGSTTREREYEIYGRVADMEALQKASSSEFQEQWGIPCNEVVMGTIRVRKTVKGDVTTINQTIKVKEEDGSDENEMDISQETFDIFKKLVPRGLLKTRYFFPLEGTDFTLEVDVFQDLEGKQCDEVKIDIEVPDGVELDQIKIPFKLEDVRVIKPGIKTPEDGEYVRNLFVNKFEVVNPYHKKKED